MESASGTEQARLFCHDHPDVLVEPRPAPWFWLVGEVQGQASLTCTCAK